MRSTLAVALGLAALLFLAPLAVAPAQGYREIGTISTAAILAGTTFVSDPADLHRIGGFDVQPLDDDDDDDDDEDEDNEAGDDDGEEGEDDEDEEDDDDDDDDDDVDICHVPPGNPAAAHSITVGAPAVPAHLGHDDGDGLDSCPDDEGDDDDEDDDEDDEDGETDSPSIELTLSAETLDEGQSVLASWTVTNFVLDSAAIGSTQNVQGRGHAHVLVDGELVSMTASGSLELGDLEVGTHTIRVELRNNDHSALTPAVSDEATVDVTANGPSPATVGADPTWLFWILAIVIAMIAAAGAVLYRRRRHKPGP